MSGNDTEQDSSGLNMVVKHLQTFSVVIFCVITFVGTLGNGLVIYVTGFKMKKTVNSVWFLNLALADFLFTAFLIFSALSLYQDNNWPFGIFMCKLNTFVSVINMFASVLFLTTISLDRCLSIWVVVWAQNNRTVLKAQIISAVIWLAAGICSAPYTYYRTVMNKEFVTTCYYNITDKAQWSLNIFRFLMGFLIPFLAIVFSSVAISMRSRRLQRQKTQRFHRIIFSVVFAFFICWLPFHVLIFVEHKVDNVNLFKIGGPLIVCLAYMNSCLNPILYVFMCHDFQKKLKQSICLVLESALTDDHLSLVSSRSFSSHFLRISRKSDSTTPEEKLGNNGFEKK